MHKVSRFFQPLPCPAKITKSLYLLKCNQTGLYKVGSTNGDVRTRISKLYNNSKTDERTIQIIKVWKGCGFCERYILSSFEKLRVPHPFYTNGHTEWFQSTIDEAHIIRAIESIINSLT